MKQKEDLKWFIFHQIYIFGHQRNFLYQPRGFNSIEEHDTQIIKNWNEIITNEDEVYILGDLMLNNNEEGIKKLQQLNGKIHVILRKPWQLCSSRYL